MRFKKIVLVDELVFQYELYSYLILFYFLLRTVEEQKELYIQMT